MTIAELHKKNLAEKAKKINLKDRVEYKLPNGKTILTHPENVKVLDKKYKKK